MPTPNGEFAPIEGARAAPVSVSQLLRSVRDTLERRFPLMWVAGEISNFTRAASGHLYFTLKDDEAQVDCVMFRGRAAHLDWTPKEGTRVEARALVTLYEPRGRFQLNVETMRHAGLGPLYERFLRLKEQLAREGLFDPASKRELPEHPRAIGVITSLSAAALRDVLTTLARRNPSLGVIVYPVPVQGDGAAERIAAMLATANARAECDVLLLVRGGGSLEDLWQFNEQAVARAIRASRIPVVVGVGHETDFTIADFAADRRAPTPTAAAELVSAPRAELLARIAELALRAGRESLRRIGYAMQTVDGLARRLVHPADRVRASRQLVAQLAARLVSANARHLDAATARIERLGTALSSLDPTAVLARGYSITRNASGEVLKDAARVAEGERLVTTLSKGRIESEVRRRES
jgi:exodeoxyribonuclease VII large subunit